MADFLFEIGLEEVPARMLAGAQAELLKRTVALLERERLIPAGAKAEAFSTPRRLAVLIHNVAERQEDLSEELLGPAAKSPTKTASPVPQPWPSPKSPASPSTPCASSTPRKASTSPRRRSSPATLPPPSSPPNCRRNSPPFIGPKTWPGAPASPNASSARCAG